jgi:hypothetical protein
VIASRKAEAILEMSELPQAKQRSDTAMAMARKAVVAQVLLDHKSRAPKNDS